jgi:hypothetical protein
MENLKYSAILSTFKIIFRDKTQWRHPFSEYIFKLLTNIDIISEILINSKFDKIFTAQRYNGDMLAVQVETVNAVIFKISISLKSTLRTQTYQTRRLNMFENRVLRRIFRPKRDEITGEWRKLHNEELMICTTHPVLFGWSNRKE